MKARRILWLTLFYAGFGRAQDDLNSLLASLDAIRAQQNVAAYAVVITTPSQVMIAENRGSLTSENRSPVSDDAYFRVGSITKSFIGLAALIAEQEGLLQLMDPAQTYIGNSLYQNPWQQSHPVTVAQLLQHSAGLPDMSSREEFNHNQPITNRQGLTLFAKQRHTLWPPGQYYSYSNTGFGLAGHVIEMASKQSINDFLRDKIFQPLRMQSATLEYTQAVQAKLVPGFDSDGTTRLPYWHMIFPAFGALNIQPRDMANFIQLYLNRGKFNNDDIISENLFAQIEKPSTTLAAQQGLAYGYGLGIYNWYRRGHEFFGHGGDGDGYLARFGYSHAAQLGYFVVINRYQHQPLRDMQVAIEDWIVRDLPAVEFPPAMSMANPGLITGEYRQITSRFGRRGNSVLTIINDDGQLYTEENSRERYLLIPVTDTTFRRRNEPTATIAIVETADGLVYVGDDGNFLKKQ